MSNVQRPDPDILLAQIQASECKNIRGKLRIYFGSSAGVGKTFAMLEAAHKAQEAGLALLIGWVETHGRRETDALVQSLPLLPRKNIIYHDKVLQEFDLDAALMQKPALLLVDEFAHTNVVGSRHPKRWQDVEELLAAGINVWTTLNVQHLESLNDVVGGITGVRVMETVPDRVFNEADEVVLVDVPVEELLSRLQAGKVYVPQQAQRATQHFFRKGNLIALREIALRRTADRIQKDVQHYKKTESIRAVWKTEGAILACVNEDVGMAEQVIRRAARLAGQMSVGWHVLYVETAMLQRLPVREREYVLGMLKLAEGLGGHTAIVAGDDVAQCVVDYAHQYNLDMVVVGCARRSIFGFWRDSFARRVAALSPALDLLQVGYVSVRRLPLGVKFPSASEVGQGGSASGWMPLLVAVLVSLLTTVVTMGLLEVLGVDLVNLVMLHLLAVVLVAVKWGRVAAIVATLLNVAAFDFFLVPPRFSFAVSDVEFLFTFGVMLLVGLMISELTAGLRFQARVAAHRERRVSMLFELARDLSGALKTEQIVEMSLRLLQQTFGGRVFLLLPDEKENLVLPVEGQGVEGLDIGIAQWAFEHEESAGFATNTLPANPFRYLPLRAPVRIRGILAIQPLYMRWLLIPEQLRQLETCARVIAIALERVHFVEVAQDMLVQVESERLRNTLLSALSHDLRTPLTVLRGVAESLVQRKAVLPLVEQGLVMSMYEMCLRMMNLVNNLLDMARIEAGKMSLQRELYVLEEVVGSAIRAVRVLLGERVVRVLLPSELPLVPCDAVLLERVFINLLENAAKYTPADAEIEIRAGVLGAEVEIEVADNGVGLPEAQMAVLFEKFTRGEDESATTGIGLGLSICRAIVRAHRGSITAENQAQGGALFRIRLPLLSSEFVYEPEHFID